MSEQDPSPGFEERDDRTVFRPMPAARPSTIAPESGSGPAGDQTIFRPSMGGRRPRDLAADERASLTRPALLSAPAAPPPPRQSAVQTLDLEAPNENPVMRAAGPLLLLLGRLRTSLLRASGSSLIPQIAAAIETSERDMLAAGIAAADVDTAKFVLCATADEVLANLPGADQAPARRSGLLTRFFGESDGSRRFFDELDRVKENAKAHCALLELFHVCLALGFQGTQRTLPGGAATLQDIRADLHERLQGARPAPPRSLSPRWEGQSIPGHAARLRIPVWTAAGVVGLVLFLVFVTLRMSLGNRAEAAATVMTTLNPTTPVTIGRKVAVAPPPSPPPTPAQASQLDHIRKVLEPHIAAGSLGVEATANQIVIHITDRVLFQPGKATVLDDVRPLMMYIALALDDEKGPIKVVGHSDNKPISNARFSSNFELSLERAKTVAALLGQSLSHPERVEAEGKGADVPIATNETVEGRAKNRRVEIIVLRGDRAELH